jgi:hypothetical protein
MNLSNFNKKVHIETCKIKQLKKATAVRLRQQNMSTKTNRKRCKKESQTNYNNINSSLIENLGIDAVTNHLTNHQQQQLQYHQAMNSSGITSLNLEQHSQAIHSALNHNLNQNSSLSVNMVQQLLPINLSGQIEQINQNNSNNNGIFI